MAFFKPKDEETASSEVEKEQPIGTNAPAAQIAPQGQQTGITEPKGSGNFTNLSKFIEANKGKSEKYAGIAADRTKQTGTSAIETLNTEGEAAKSAFTVPKYTQGQLFKTSTADLGGLQDVASVTGEEEAKYNAPFMSAKGQTQAEEANKLIQGTNTSAGLSNIVGSGYTQDKIQGGRGVQAFDTMLLKRDPAAQGRFEQLRGWAAGKDASSPLSGVGLTGYSGKIGQDVAATGQQRLGEARRAADLLQYDVKQGQEGLTGRESAAQKAAERLNATYANLTSTPTREFSTGKKVSIMDYISPRIGEASATSQLSADDFARLNAYSILSGKGPLGPQEKYTPEVFDKASYEAALARGQAEVDAENLRIENERKAAEEARVEEARRTPNIAGATTGVVEGVGNRVRDELIVNPTNDLINAVNQTLATPDITGWTQAFNTAGAKAVEEASKKVSVDSAKKTFKKIKAPKM